MEKELSEVRAQVQALQEELTQAQQAQAQQAAAEVSGVLFGLGVCGNRAACCYGCKPNNKRA